jgi:uncharacterized protein
MRRSRYTVSVKDFPSVGTTLLYHTLTGAFAEVDNAATDAELSVDPSLSDDDTGFFVTDEAVDDARFQDWYDALCRRRDELSVIVSVTQACNFDCTYCCQADVLDGRTMSPATAEATAAWLVARAREVGATTLDLAFVGGEPLLQPRRIETIVEQVRRELGPSAVRFSLITNGLFLTRELVERWRPLGLVGAQVTLDGDESTHGITRPTKKGENAFATIFANVVACHELIKIEINGNFQPNTVHGFPALLDQLVAAGVRGVSTRLTPALEALGAPSGSGSGGCTISASRPDLMLALRDEAVLRGFRPADMMRLGPCGLHREQHYAVDVEGHVYKCPGFLGKPEFAVGDVYAGVDERYGLVLEAVRRGSPSCTTCVNRPDCAGGCVATEWLKKGAPVGVNCEHEYFAANREAYLRREYAGASDEPFDVEPALRLASIVGVDQRPLHERHDGRRSPALRVVA